MLKKNKKLIIIGSIIVILILVVGLNLSNSKISNSSTSKTYDDSLYDKNVTYDQLIRTPDDYVGKKIKIYGKVIQVVESKKEVNLRVAMNNHSETIVLAAYSPGLSKERILEGDTVNMSGTSGGIYTYDAKLGGTISIPSMLLDRITIIDKK